MVLTLATSRCCLVEVELLGIEMVQRGEKFDAELGSVEDVAVGEGDVDAGDRLAVVGVVVGGLVDGEAGGSEGDSGNVAGGEVGGESGGVDVGRADVLEGRRACRGRRRRWWTRAGRRRGRAWRR